MIDTLAKKLSDAKGGPIDFQDKAVVMSYKMPINKGQEVFVEILNYNTTVDQGFELSVDQRKGFIEVNGQKLKSPIFWTKTAPTTFSFKCYPKKAVGSINIWNVWRNIEHKDNVDAWIGHAGLYVEHGDDDSIIFHCSNGIQQVDFNDLVFRINVK